MIFTCTWLTDLMEKYWFSLISSSSLMKKGMITQCVIHIFVWLSGPDGEVLVIKTLNFPFYLI